MPAPKIPNTEPARLALAAKRKAGRHEREISEAAARLAVAGWLPIPPEVMEDLHGRPAEYIAAIVAEQWERAAARVEREAATAAVLFSDAVAKTLMIEIMRKRRNKIESDLVALARQHEEVCQWLAEHDADGIPDAERPDPDHACAAHDDAHLGRACPDRT